MYTQLGTADLKSGEKATIARVMAPDVEWGEKIVPFLGHKERITRWQIEETVMGNIGRLESYYYIAQLGDEVIGTIATWEYVGAGILGHVFTDPKHRQKGAAKAIMAEQMEDFRRRSGKALFLGTGYDSVAYYIYYSFGFRSVYPESGFMDYYSESEEAFESTYFAAGPASVREPGWHDWAGLTTLMAASRGPTLRMFSTGMIRRRNFEGAFIKFYNNVLFKAGTQARVLEADSTKSVVGVAYLTQDERFGGPVDLLDVYAHPNFETHLGDLLDAIELPEERKVQAYVQANDRLKRKALEASGFEVEAVFENQINGDRGPLDVAVLARG